jgi:hypothetical protein
MNKIQFDEPLLSELMYKAHGHRGSVVMKNGFGLWCRG